MSKVQNKEKHQTTCKSSPYDNKLENMGEIDKFLNICNLPKLNQKDVYKNNNKKQPEEGAREVVQWVRALAERL